MSFDSPTPVLLMLLPSFAPRVDSAAPLRSDECFKFNVAWKMVLKPCLVDQSAAAMYIFRSQMPPTALDRCAVSQPPEV